jgi:hypothetical protein
MRTQTADDAAVIVFDAMQQEGWSDALAEAIADLVREGVRAATLERCRVLARLLHGWDAGLADRSPSARAPTPSVEAASRSP